jgi:hypothetical protein
MSTGQAETLEDHNSPESDPSEMLEHVWAEIECPPYLHKWNLKYTYIVHILDCRHAACTGEKRNA